MLRLTHTLVVLAALIASLPACAMAQANLAGTTEPDPLPGLPRPPDQPGSLLQPAPTTQLYADPELQSPYLAYDPRLDPVELPHPGWIFDVETGILGANVISRLGQTTTPMPGVAPVPMAALNWNVSPRIELGYRLPSGFGEFDFAYRYLWADGTGSTAAGSIASPDGAAALVSHLNMSVWDLDYANHETSLWPTWDMKWRIGVRAADIAFDSTATETIAAASAGSGIYARGVECDFGGIGPHAAVELKRRPNSWGLGLVAKVECAVLFGEAHQQFTQAPTTGPASVTDFSNPEGVPEVSGFVGLDWHPRCSPSLDLLLGYSGEYWWNVGRISNPDIYSGQSAGEVVAQGVVLRLECNY